MLPPKVEQHHIHTPNPGVPNSRFPVLVYRSVVTPSPSSASPSRDGDSSAQVARELGERNHWSYGGTFKTYWRAHFHSVTHECYAVVKGCSRLRLGVGPQQPDEGKGVEVDLGVGDVIVLPAGVSHCSITSEGDYEYLGFYPEGSPKYDNNFCKAGEGETRIKAETARKVPIPEWDPVFGYKGPLWEIWGCGCRHGD